MMKFLITGGAGFIGSALIRHIITETDHAVINIDKLTYSGNLENLKEVSNNPRYNFVKGDICDRNLLDQIFKLHKPNAIMHLAAESHVDRSIEGPDKFVQTNIVGTVNLLEAARQYWQSLPSHQRTEFRFHHISTDEVYGDLANTTELFTEYSPYAPSSPYSASKAASDHFVRAWHRTYGLPILITNCSNNYGPYHFPEKLIPLIILNAIKGKPLPIYGKGNNVRDWLYVDDHARALYKVIMEGKVGETYNTGGSNERTNVEVVETICDILEELLPEKPAPMIKNNQTHYRNLMCFVEDRPGHDLRYAINANRIKSELGWEPIETFDTGIRKTVQWFLQNEWWWHPLQEKTYKGERLGLNVSTNKHHD